MPIDVTTEGSGSLGDLNPGWSVQEFATPRSPADAAGGTGIASYSGGAKNDSGFLISKGATVTHPELGDFSGVIRNVGLAGLTATISQDSVLSRFDADRNIPPLVSGCVPAALDLADQLTGTARLTRDDGTFWSLAGHGAGFNSSGELVPFGQQRKSYTYYDNSTLQFETISVVNYTDAAIPLANTVIDGEIYATGVQGDSLDMSKRILPPGAFIVGTARYGYSQIVAFKTLLNSGDTVFAVQGMPLSATQGSGQLLTVTVDESASNIIISSEYYSAGLVTTTTDTVSISSLDLTEELALFIKFTGIYDDVSSPANDYYANVTICNTSDYATYLTADINYQPDGRDVYFLPWETTGNVRALWRTFLGGTDSTFAGDPVVPVEYESPANYSFTGTPLFGEPSIGVNSNLWRYLQDACAAYGWEIGLEDNVPVARPIGLREMDITNYSPSPALALSSTFTGRQVNVTYYNSELVIDGEVYSARDDDNRILSVGAAQTTTTTVNTGSYLLAAIDPTRTTTFIPAQGTYYVVDSTGLPIVADQWEDYGGNVTVSVNPEIAGAIDITVTGPSEEIPSTTAPYSLAVSDGENQYAALSIFGSGIITNEATLELLTGADPDKTTQQVATTIVNPHIGTRERAFDSGIWASVDASGPLITLNVTVPTRALTGFGLTPGSLIPWEESTYRVMSSSVGNLNTSLACARHATVGDFDAVWSGQTVADHDAAWDGFVASDQVVRPYKPS